MKNYRNGRDDIGPDRTERTPLPPTWTMIRSGEVGCVISTGPVVTPVALRAPADA